MPVVGVPSHLVAVVDLGVVAFAQQRGVAQRGLGRRRSSGRGGGRRTTRPGRGSRRTRIRRRGPRRPGGCGRAPAGGRGRRRGGGRRAEQDAGDVAVAGRLPGHGVRRGRARAQPCGGGAGVGVGQVLELDERGDLRLGRAEHGQVAGGQVQRGQLDEGVGGALVAGAQVALAAPGGGDRLERGLDLLPAAGVELAADHPGAVSSPRDPQPAALGGVGRWWAVGVDGVGDPPAHIGQGARCPHRGLGDQQVQSGQVDPGRVAGGPDVVGEDPPDHRHLPGADPTGGRGGTDRGHPPGQPPRRQHRSSLRPGQVSVPAQPRLHPGQPVGVGGVLRLGVRHGARQLGLREVDQPRQAPCPVQQLRARRPAVQHGPRRAQHRLDCGAHVSGRRFGQPRRRSHGGGSRRAVGPERSRREGFGRPLRGSGVVETHREPLPPVRSRVRSLPP